MPTQIGTLNAAYVGAVPFLAQREIDPNLYDGANEKQFSDTMQIFGRMMEGKMWNFHSFINNNTYQVLQVDTVTVNNSNQVTFVLTAATSGFVRQFDLIKFTNGLRGWVKTAPTHTSTQDTITVRSVDQQGLSVTAGDILVAPANAMPESSGAVSSLIYGTDQYANLIQVFAESHLETDVEKLTPVEVTVEGKPYYGVYQFITKLAKLKTGISATMFDGRISSGSTFDNSGSFLTDPNTGLPTQTTMGLDQWVKTYGINTTVNTRGVVTTADIDNLIGQMNAAKAPLTFLGFTGTSAKTNYEDLLKNFTQATGLNSVRLMIDGKDVDMEVDTFHRGNHNFKFVPTSILDHPQLFNYHGAPDISQSIYWTPDGMCPVVGGQGREPYIGIKYKKQAVTGGYGDDIISEVQTGALAPVPTNDIRNWAVTWASYQGLAVVNPKHIAKQLVATAP